MPVHRSVSWMLLLPYAHGYLAVSGMMRNRPDPPSDAKAAAAAAVAGVTLAAAVGCVDAVSHLDVLLQSSQTAQVHVTAMAAASRLGLQPAIMPVLYAFSGLNLFALSVLPLLASSHRYEPQASSVQAEDLPGVVQDQDGMERALKPCDRAVFDDPEAGVFCVELPTLDGGMRWVCV